MPRKSCGMNGAPSECEVWASTAEAEVDGESSFDFSGSVVEQIRTIASAADGIERGALQYGRAADDVGALDGSGGGDDGLNDDGPLNARDAGDRWILRVNGSKQVAGENAFRDTEGAGRCSWRGNYVRNGCGSGR